MSEADPWGTESGLLTNYEGTVIDAFFGKDPDYNPDTRMLFLKMSTDSPEKPEHEERYNLPPGWETWDGGQTVENRERGDSARFNANSAIGKLMTAIAKEDCAAGLDVLKERGSQREAGVWIGTRWFFEETKTPYKFKARADGPKGKKGDWIEGETVKNYPTRFLGTTEITGDTPGTPGSQTSEQAVATGEVPSGGSAIPDADRTIIKLYAKQKDSHPEWVEAVMEHDGGRFLQNSELVAVLSDDTDAGLWAKLRSE